MPGAHSMRWLVFFVCGSLAALGCSTDTQQGDSASGSLSLDLVLADGIMIDSVSWEISGGDMEPMSGVINTSAPGSTASVEVFGIPPGEDYLVELEATSVDGDVTCRGSAPFDVEIGVSTDVMVILNCKLPPRLGGVRVNGKFNICAELLKLVVSPLQTSVGNDIDLISIATDAEGDAITYVWSASGGSIADPNAPSTTYTCQEVGEHEVSVSVTDNDVYCDMATWTVPITCVGGDGACTNEDDVAVYADLTYTDEDGNTFTGPAASAAIGSDCIFGTDTSDPVLSGCGDKAFDVISCFPNCDDSITQALADCVAQCTQDATGLSSECMACTGDTVACGAAFCTPQCVADTNAPACIECRCDNNCTPAFDMCSGLPSSGDCGAGGAPVEAGLYEFSCKLTSFDLPVTIKINAADPGFTQGETSDMTSRLDYIVAPDIISLLPGIAPDAEITGVTSEVAVAGGTPALIDGYTVAGLPMEPVPEFSSEPLMTAVTADADATEIALSVTAMSATIDGIPEALVPGGELTLEAGVGDCTELTVVDGSGPLTFDVSGAGGAD